MTARSIAGLTVFPANPPANNNPPVWDSQPSILFVVGVSKNIDMNDISSDPDMDVITFTMNTGAASLPAGVTWTAATGVLAYDGSASTTSGGHIITLDDGQDTTDSITFSINVSQQATTGFPRLAAIRINSRAYAEDNATGDFERSRIALADVCVLGLIADSSRWDGGNPDYLQRDEIYDDLMTKNPDLYMFDYTDVMEKSEESSGNFLQDALDGGVGPGGSDWWAYKDVDDGFDITNRVSTFGTSYNTNLTTFVTPDGNGNRYPEVYAISRQIEFLDKSTTRGTGKGGINIFNDVMRLSPKSSNTDFDGDGVKDDARKHFDPTDSEHMAVNDGDAVAVAAAWRAGLAAYLNKLKDDNLSNGGLLVMGETPGWSRQYGGTDPNNAPTLPAEYINLLHGGHLNQQMRGTSFSLTGVLSDGKKDPDTNFGSWQLAFNSYTYCLDNMLTPAGLDAPLVINDFHVLLSPYPLSNSPQGNAIETSDPQTGTAFNAFRWALSTTLQGNGYLNISGEPGSNFHNTPIFDEYGLINTGTTGLSAKWLGNAIDAPQLLPKQGDNIYARKFDNGIAIVNTDKDETNPATTVVLATIGINAGDYKRITGVQDSGFNDGSTVNGNFSLEPIDGILLEKI